MELFIALTRHKNRTSKVQTSAPNWSDCSLYAKHGKTGLRSKPVFLYFLFLWRL